MWQRIFKHGLTVLLGLVLAGLLVWCLISQVVYWVNGVSTAATVLDVEVKQVGIIPVDEYGQGGRPEFQQQVLYQYQDRQGTEFVGTSATALTTVTPAYHKGDTLDIRYLRHWPATSRPAAPMDLSDQPWGLLLLALVLGAGIIALAAWWVRQDSFLHFVSRIKVSGLLRSFKKRRRDKLIRPDFPHAWLLYLRKNVRQYPLLTPVEQEVLHNNLRIFLAETSWEGCGGLVLTDEIKVTIAAQACVLLLGIQHDYFSHVPSVLVYPTSFAMPDGHHGPDGVVHTGVGLLGQAWYRGPVILAWDEVLAGRRSRPEGSNVVYHEFAHQLDFMGEWGNLQSRPGSREQLRRWQEVMSAEYDKLVRASAQGRATLLDQYGAASPAEFFAVATECFFELPVQLHSRQPELYAVLRDFYGQDTAARLQRAQHD